MHATSELQFSRDGRVAAARPSPHEIQIWNVTSGTKVAVVTPATPISRWSLRPDGRMIAIVSEGRLSLADVTSRAAPAKVVLPANVERVDWRSDGKALFASRGEQTDIVDTAGAVTASIAAVAAAGGISADGRWLLSREGAMWDVRANKERWKTPAAPGSVAFSDDGQSIAFASGAQSIAVVDAASGSKRWEVSTKGPRSSDLALSPDGQSVAAFDNGESGDQGMVGQGMALWYRGKRTRLWESQNAMPGVRPTFSPDGKLLAFIASGEIKLADARTGGRTKQSKSIGEIRPESPRWSEDSRTILQGGSSSGGLVVFDVARGDRKVIGKSATEIASTVYHDAIWSPDDGAVLIIAEQTSRSIATIVDLKTGTPRETLEARAGGPVARRRFRSAEWSGTAGLIALTRSDGVALWDGRTKQPARVIDTGEGETDDRQVAFAPQGNLLATLATPNKEARLWDPKTGTRVRVFSVPGNGAPTDGAGSDDAPIEAMAFSADGTRFALAATISSGSEQSTHIAIFDTASGALLRTLHAPRHYTYGTSGYGRTAALQFTPQGRGLVAVDGTGRVDLWNTATDDPPTTLIEKATPGPSALADGGNLLLMGTPALDVWDLRTRTLSREFRGEGSTILRARVARGGGAVAVARVDRVDLHRLADRSYLTLRMAPSPSQGVAIVADNGAFSGTSATTSQLRVRDGAELEVRPLRANELSTLNRPGIGLDFVAGCPMGPAQ